jgi:elongation factor Ts
MAVSQEMVKALRESSGAGVMACKKALEKAEGEGLAGDAQVKRATQILQDEGAEKMARRQDREASQGLVYSYIHGGRVGALVEINCETDFVARNDAFQQLAREVAMQVASMNPQYIDVTEVPADDAANAKELALLAQPYIRDGSRTIADLVADVSRQTGEVVRVRRFVRYEVGH